MRRDKSRRALVIAGLVTLVLGTVDPLEGSLVIFAGAAMVAVGAWLGSSERVRLAVVALALIGVGVVVMWGLSAVGGFGGATGRSNWWWIAIVPYPLGLVMALIIAIRILLDKVEPPRTA